MFASPSGAWRERVRERESVCVCKSRSQSRSKSMSESESKREWVSEWVWACEGVWEGGGIESVWVKERGERASKGIHVLLGIQNKGT